MPNQEFLMSKIESFNKLFMEYLNKLDCMDTQYRQATVSSVFGKGGEGFHRGFYTPSLSESIMISNAYCGRLLKRITSKTKPSAQYGYDNDGRLILVDRFEYPQGVQAVTDTELLIYQDDTILSIGFRWDENLQQNTILYISESIYCENRLVFYTYGTYGTREPLCWILKHQRNTYEGNRLIASNLQELSYDPLEASVLSCIGGDAVFSYQDSTLVHYEYTESGILKASPPFVKSDQLLKRTFKGPVSSKKTPPYIKKPVKPF